MKFIVKDKSKQIGEQYKEVEIPVLQIGTTLGTIPVAIYNFPNGFSEITVNVCTKITSLFLSIGNLPFVTLASGIVFVFSAALLTSEVIELINNLDEKQTNEVEQSISEMLKKKILLKQSLSTNLKKEEK